MKKSLVVALGLLAGCASNPPTPDHPAAAATPAAAPVQDDVQLLAAYPKTDYEDLGTFQFTFFRGGMLTPSLESVMTELKEKVRHAGGNAFVVLNQSPDRADKRVLHVSTEVLKVK